MIRLLLAFLCLLSFMEKGSAGEIKRLELEKTEEGFYLIEAELKVEAGKRKILSLLTDYGRLTRLNSQILESELIKVSAEGVSQVRTTIRPCGYLFCKTIHQVQNLEIGPKDSIIATILPEESDFHEGSAEWFFQEKEGAVFIHFKARLRPRFWIPPVVNLWVMEKMVENEMAETIFNLETLQPR